MNLNLRLKKISEVINGQLEGDPESVIDNIIIDSRKFITPDKTLFLAITGDRNDGHDYIEELIKTGVTNFILEKRPAAKHLKNINLIIVENSVEALQLLGGYVRKKFKGIVVGITGSNGKTILKEWINQAMSSQVKLVRSPQSYNSQVGVPLSLFLVDNAFDLAIIEAGISKPREMDKLRKIIEPNIGIMTNLGEAHQENFSSLRDKAVEKLRLFASVDKLIYCGDYKIVHQEVMDRFPPEKLVSWGMSSDFDYYISKEISLTGSNIHIEGKISSIIPTPYRDFASIENCIHLMVFLYEQGFSTDFIRRAVSALEPISMRMEMLRGSNNCTIINDSYNSDIISLSNALDYLELQVQHNKKTLIISDILQSGQESRQLYGKVAEMIKKRKIDRVVAIGEKLRENRDLFPEKAEFYSSTDIFISQFSKFKFINEAILLKGARRFEFERISHLLQESTHRTILEIDLTALVDNYRWYRSKLKPGVRMMVMVKAFSYGSGGYEIANLLQYHNVEYLAVAYTDEGVDLRKNGVKIPIMVMSPEISDFNLLIEFNLEPEIYSKRIFNQFNHFLDKAGIDSYPIHLKVDTGMHRLGFSVEELDEISEDLNNSHMRVLSVFSHLAASDAEIHDDFTWKPFYSRCIQYMPDK
jgi:alanine racemase